MFRRSSVKGWSVLVVALVMMVSMAYADEVETVKPMANRLESIREKVVVQREESIERREVYRNRMTQVVTDFAPDLLGDFKAFWKAHDAVHTALTSLHQSHSAEVKSEAEQIKALAKTGEITREEAKQALASLREQNKAEHEADRAAVEALKVTFGIDAEAIKALHAALKAAVEADDAIAVESALLEILEAQEQHLNFDQAKLSYFESK